MKNELMSLITNKQAQAGVIGLGYVGLPLLVEFASKGFRATGFEVDENKAQQINQGQSYIGDVPCAATQRNGEIGASYGPRRISITSATATSSSSAYPRRCANEGA
jgi:UDP-N-acetyl-D-mannosaminuronate dehydrogenase